MGDKKKQNKGIYIPCRICKRTNHLEKDCYFRGKPQCRNCKRFGHVEKDCRLKGNHQANCIEENNSSDQLFYTCNSVAEIGEATWYIDSAASNHMTYNKGAFQTLDESFKTNVKLGDNHIVKVEGKGSVAINTRKVEEGVTLPKDSSTSSSAEKGKLENKKAKDSEALYYIQTAVADHIFQELVLLHRQKKHGAFCKRNIKAVQSWSLEAYEKRRSRREENSLENAFQSKLNMRSQNSNRKEENFKSTMGDKKKQNKGIYIPCRICKRTNHLEKDCYFRGKPQCRNCKRFGHVEKDCRLKGNHQANCIEENNSSDQLFYTCNSVAAIGEATWYIDSAASNHMTYNKGAFQTLDESFKTHVKLGDNHIVKVEGKGSVAINTRKGTRIINDVMYIPNLRTNLFSVGQMMEKGYTLHFEEIHAPSMTTKIKL
ncbi:hypothetical protein Sango_0987800 [Sesamum angolense]|uniref:CCHC-type domain-containing protein n=1 Tax=Sesamum angolense TaxID=2727404 RepID=A0AAE2BYJ8_9LAMI|nr:hypothetical protein Sango_0987800 [Sesamum angolense]